MGFLSDLFFGKEAPASPLAGWAQHGSKATRKVISQQRAYGVRERKRNLRLLNQSYLAQKRGLTSGFRQQLKKTQTGVARSAASRGLGKSTMALALQPTEAITAQRQQALSGLRSQYLGQRAGIKEVPSHYYSFLGKKAALGALEPWELYRTQQGRSGGLAGTLGTAIGSYYGGPIGGQIGGYIGGNIS